MMYLLQTFLDYENTSMQYTEIFFKSKKLKFNWKKKKRFFLNNSSQNIHLRGGANEYSQCMLCIKNKKIRY